MRYPGFCFVGTVAPIARSKRFAEGIAAPLRAVVGVVRNLCAVVGICLFARLSKRQALKKKTGAIRLWRADTGPFRTRV